MKYSRKQLLQAFVKWNIEYQKDPDVFHDSATEDDASPVEVAEKQTETLMDYLGQGLDE